MAKNMQLVTAATLPWIATSPDRAGGPLCTTSCDSYFAPAEEPDLPFQDQLEALSV